MGTTAFRFLLVGNGKAELLAASIVFLAWVETHQVGRCGLDVSVKNSNIHQPIKTIPDYLVPTKCAVLIFSGNTIKAGSLKLM